VYAHQDKAERDNFAGKIPGLDPRLKYVVCFSNRHLNAREIQTADAGRQLTTIIPECPYSGLRKKKDFSLHHKLWLGQANRRNSIDDLLLPVRSDWIF
jgi:hypothetical protein